ncbi:hypothetical protein FGM00_16320 [Aggregatimonas sangjinii]|uniref:Uncharacterized protein n=1 Tax=Aggregatimonas sangjinii TaxID=2583587 RepID=A0A5B7SX46_9FLAO|nr:hypothetical protein [Aggregatimonas sangjinii]QCX01598.1 hypothetical protein FGM00_16320 [Aggregatimonas sangjinii]
MRLLFVPFKVPLITLLFVGLSFAQERVTKEAKIIVVVNEKLDAVEQIELYASFQKLKEKQLEEKYAHHKFFLGVLKGTYTITENWIVPGKNTTIVMYTDKRFYPPDQFYRGDDLAPGDALNLGTTMAKVIANKQGELILKTE